MPSFVARSDPAANRPDPDLDRILRRTLLVGLALVLLLPLARAYSPWLGWGPLWLIGMPAMAWWALHRFPLPRLADLALRSGGHGRSRRSSRAQARRRKPVARTLPKAA